MRQWMIRGLSKSYARRARFKMMTNKFASSSSSSSNNESDKLLEIYHDHASNAKTAQDLEKVQSLREKLLLLKDKKPLLIHNTYFKALANIGDGDLAEKYLNEMEGKGVPPSRKTYGKIIQAFLKQGKQDKAEEYIERMLDIGIIQSQNNEEHGRRKYQLETTTTTTATTTTKRHHHHQQQQQHNIVRTSTTTTMRKQYSAKSAALMISSILEIAQFFVMLLEVDFLYSSNLYSQLRFNYILGWSTGIVGTIGVHILSAFTGLSLETVGIEQISENANTAELTGIERLAFESRINPNYLAQSAAMNFVLAAAVYTGFIVGMWGLNRVLSPYVNTMRTAQADIHWWWLLYKGLAIILLTALYPCFSLGTYFMSFCYSNPSYKYSLELGSGSCAAGSFFILLVFLMYAGLLVQLCLKVPSRREYIDLFLHGRSNAIWGHFWRMYKFEQRYVAVLDICVRILTGIMVGAVRSRSVVSLVFILLLQTAMFLVILVKKPYLHGHTAILLNALFALRVGLCSIVFVLEVTSEKDFRRAISWVLLMSYLCTLFLCLCFFAYHQGRKLLLDFISACLPCIRGACTRWLVMGELQARGAPPSRRGHHRAMMSRDSDLLAAVVDEDHPDAKRPIYDSNAVVYAGSSRTSYR